MRKSPLKAAPSPPLFVVIVPRRDSEFEDLDREFRAAAAESPQAALDLAQAPGPEKIKLRAVLELLRLSYLAALPNHHVQVLLALLEHHPRTLPTTAVADVTSVKRRTLEDTLNGMPRYIHRSLDGVARFGLTDDGVQLAVRLLRTLM